MGVVGVQILLITHLSYICSAGKVDLTLQVGSSGAATVRSVLAKIEQANLFNFPWASSQQDQMNEQFMREMAFVESEDGENSENNGMNGGIWRVDKSIFRQTQSYNYSSLHHSICKAFCIDWYSVRYSDLSKPLYSGLAVRIYMYHLDITGRGLAEGSLDKTKAEFWLKTFQNDQKQFYMKWFLQISQLRRIEDMNLMTLLFMTFLIGCMIQVCRVDTDAVFVLDSSGSIGSTNYQLVREYTYNFTKYLLSGENNNRVGIVIFGNTAQVEVHLNYSMGYGKQNLLASIQHLPYLGESTNTPEALCLLNTMDWRDTISTLRLAVVLTDGRSNQRSRYCGNGRGTVETTSTEIHDRQPQIVVSAIGVTGNVVYSELELIATSNDTIDTLHSFEPSLLEQNQYYRSYSTCYKVVQEVPVSQETEGTAEEGSVSRLKFSGSRDEGVSIKICVEVGGIIVYGSYTNPNPGPALYDFMEELSETMDSQCLTTHVDQNTTTQRSSCLACGHDRPKREIEMNQVTIYITIEGSVNRSQFTVNSDFGKTLIDGLKDGCLGDSSLCDDDATVVCGRNASELCECVYAEGLEHLPLCYVTSSVPTKYISSGSTKLKDVPQSSKLLSNEIFILLVSSVTTICVCGLIVVTAICIGCGIKKHRKKQSGQYIKLQRVTSI